MARSVSFWDKERTSWDRSEERTTTTTLFFCISERATWARVAQPVEDRGQRRLGAHELDEGHVAFFDFCYLFFPSSRGRWPTGCKGEEMNEGGHSDSRRGSSKRGTWLRILCSWRMPLSTTQPHSRRPLSDCLRLTGSSGRHVAESRSRGLFTTLRTGGRVSCLRYELVRWLFMIGWVCTRR